MKNNLWLVLHLEFCDVDSRKQAERFTCVWCCWR